MKLIASNALALVRHNCTFIKYESIYAPASTSTSRFLLRAGIYNIFCSSREQLAPYQYHFIFTTLYNIRCLVPCVFSSFSFQNHHQDKRANGLKLVTPCTRNSRPTFVQFNFQSFIRFAVSSLIRFIRYVN